MDLQEWKTTLRCEFTRSTRNPNQPRRPALLLPRYLRLGRDEGMVDLDSPLH